MNKNKIFTFKIIFSLFAAVPTVLFFLEPNPAPIYYALGQLSGILGISLMSLNFFLSSRFPPLESGIGHDRLMAWHSKTAKTAGMLLLAHPILVFTNPRYYTIYHYAGIAAFILLQMTIILAIFSDKIKIKYEIWRNLHKLVYLVAVLGFIHSFNLGSHIVEPKPLFYWWLFILTLTIATTIFRYLVKPLLTNKQIYKITSLIKQTDSVVTISLSPISKSITSHLPGQFAFAKFFSQSLPSEEHHFTISSPNSIEFTIKNSGDFTSQIGKLKKGEKVKLDGPYGTLTTKGLSGPFLFIAGGIGITPIIANIRYLNTLTNPPKSILLYANKTVADIVFYNELKKYKWLTTTHFLSQEKARGFNFGHIDQNTLEKSIKKLRNPEIFLVGPLPMMASIEKILKELDVPPSKIHTEKFSLK